MAAWRRLQRNALAALGMPALSGVAASGPLVDLALVLAIDCSFSVTEASYHLQMRGMGEAFLDPEIHRAIARGFHRRIAVSTFHWSDPHAQHMVLPWRILAGPNDAKAAAQVFFDAPRDKKIGFTVTGEAMLFGKNLLEKAPPAVRQVIDVSTDGTSNSGIAASDARDQVVAEGITINALGILDEEPFLAGHLERDVIGGNGTFFITANHFADFGAAIRRKLIRETSNSAAT
jgi:hypothetical protein